MCISEAKRYHCITQLGHLLFHRACEKSVEEKLSTAAAADDDVEEHIDSEAEWSMLR